MGSKSSRALGNVKAQLIVGNGFSLRSVDPKVEAKLLGGLGHGRGRNLRNQVSGWKEGKSSEGMTGKVAWGGEHFGVR